MSMVVTKVGGRRYVANGCTQEQAEKAFDNLNSVINLILGAANTIVGKKLYDLVEWMQKDKALYRFKVKHLVNEALRSFQRYESLHYQNFGERYEFFLDYLNEIEDALEPDIQKMYFSIKAVLDKAKVEKSELFAKINTTTSLAEISVFLYDRLIKECEEQTGFDFNELMRPGRLTGTLHYLDELEKLVCRAKGVDLNKDKNSNLAAKIIAEKLLNEDVLENAAKTALSYHEELNIEK